DAGVSKGAFYHWFPSKDALIAALAERSGREAFAGVEDAVARCDGDALARLNAVLQAGFDVKMKMGGPEQLAAMVSLLRPDNAHLYGRILAVEEALFLPLLTRLIADGVAAGVFDTFDPQGVADMIYGLAARTNSKILEVLQAADESARERAIDCLTTRFRLHGLAVNRILGLPDSSIATLTRQQVQAMVGVLPRNQ
ncbi:TetR/AcrR family transcriptional regulator, partial [Mycobacterium sp.]|uniref:TetR/AcrR family transcriptional regulator n=1 Tax=Mycobacterium sp. TaxID=1785 RepID=UPI003C7088B1